MILTSDKWKVEKLHEANVAIIGAGAAGISLALALQRFGISTILAEGGEVNYSEISQDLYDGEQFGDYYLQAGLKYSRMRFMGGSTNCWAGGCTIFDQQDFEERPWLGVKKWPLTHAELKPYYENAAAQLGLKMELIHNPSQDSRLPELKPFITRSLEYTKKLRFKLEYASDIAESKLINCMLGANFRHFEYNKNGINTIIVSDFVGNTTSIKAKNYIICAGGIESARILMNSASLHGGGFGSDTGNLGRYFCDHPIAPCATIYFDDIQLSKKLIAQTYWERGTEPYFVLPYELQKKFEVSNCAIQVFEEMPAFSEPEISAIALYQYIKGISHTSPSMSDYLNVISHPLDILEALKNRKVNNRSRLSIRFQLEQLPVKENGIHLLKEKDEFGLQKIGLNWTMDSFARKTIDINLYHLVKTLGATQSAILRLDSQLIDEKKTIPHDLRGGQHHCGMTRMGLNAEVGVVNPDLNVFGIDNLYVLSSSVFPSNSWANPTFTIVSLSHRLASHLKSKM